MTAAARRRQQARITRELAALADELEQLDRRREVIYSRRLELWLEGQAMEPRMTQRELADPARVTEGAVTQALRKVRLEQQTTNGVGVR